MLTLYFTWSTSKTMAIVAINCILPKIIKDNASRTVINKFSFDECKIFFQWAVILAFILNVFISLLYCVNVLSYTL